MSRLFNNPLTAVGLMANPSTFLYASDPFGVIHKNAGTAFIGIVDDPMDTGPFTRTIDNYKARPEDPFMAPWTYESFLRGTSQNALKFMAMSSPVKNQGDIGGPLRAAICLSVPGARPADERNSIVTSATEMLMLPGNSKPPLFTPLREMQRPFSTAGAAKERLSKIIEGSLDEESRIGPDTPVWSMLSSLIPYPGRVEAGAVNLPFVFDAVQNSGSMIEVPPSDHVHLEFEAGNGEYASESARQNPAWRVFAMDDGGATLPRVIGENSILGLVGRFTIENLLRTVFYIYRQEVWNNDPALEIKEKWPLIELLEAHRLAMSETEVTDFDKNLVRWGELLIGETRTRQNYKLLTIAAVNLAVMHSLSLDGIEPPVPENYEGDSENFYIMYLSNMVSYWRAYNTGIADPEDLLDEGSEINSKDWLRAKERLRQFGLEASLFPQGEKQARYEELYLRRRIELFGNKLFPWLTPLQTATLIFDSLLHFHFKQYGSNGKVPENLTAVRAPTAMETGFAFTGVPLPDHSVDSISWIAPYRHNTDIDDIASEMSRVLKSEWKFVEVGVYQKYGDKDFSDRTLQRFAEIIGADSLEITDNPQNNYRSVFFGQDRDMKFYRLTKKS